MNENIIKGNSSSYYGNRVSDIQYVISGPSFFALNNQETCLSQEVFSRVKSFSEFIALRTDYLNGLKNLGDNWMSGPSRQPTNKSISLSKTLLKSLEHWYTYQGSANFVYPKVVMGPTPEGGMGMEIELFPDIRAFVTILDDKVEYDVEKAGYYMNYETNSQNITSDLLALYDSEKALQ